MIFVDLAQPDDVHAMAPLLEEMDRFYGATRSDPLNLRVEQIGDALFSSPPAAYALLAKEGEQLVGLAAYSFLWPAVGLTRSLYLKELYVAETRRASGVGKLLMGRIFEVATALGFSRVEWATDRDNFDARRFYDRLGFPTQSSKVGYRVEGAEIARAAERLNGGRASQDRDDA